MKEIRKGNILYKGMVRGRRKFLIINIILTVLYCMFLISSKPYIVGKLHGPYEFDKEKFISSTESIEIYKEIKMKKRADRSIPFFASPQTSYLDGEKYRFNVKFDSFEDLGIEYATEVENPKTGKKESFVTHSLILGKIDNILVPVMVAGGEIPDANLTLSGIFTEPAEVVTSDISKLTADGRKFVINQYMFDSRGIEMNSEDSDIIFMIVGFLLLVFLYIRLIKYYINPYKQPTYKQLDKYGDLNEVIDDIEDQFESDDVYFDGKELVCKDWIMTKEPFKNKVVKNHRTRGRYS